MFRKGTEGTRGTCSPDQQVLCSPCLKRRGQEGNRLAVAVSSTCLPPVLWTPDLSLVPTPHMSKLQRGSSGGPPRRWMDMSLPRWNQNGRRRALPNGIGRTITAAVPPRFAPASTLMVAGRGAPSHTRRNLRLLRRATLVVARFIGLVLLGLPSIRNGNRRAGGAVMSDAQRQAVTELMRSSVRVAERPGPHPPGGGSLQGPCFGPNRPSAACCHRDVLDILSRACARAGCDCTDRDDQRQPTA